MMHTFSKARPWLGRLTSLGALALALGTAVACQNFLTADNPGAVEADDLNDPAYASLIGAGPIHSFQCRLAGTASSSFGRAVPCVSHTGRFVQTWTSLTVPTLPFLMMAAARRRLELDVY